MNLAARRQECFARTKKALQHSVTEDQLVIREHEMIKELQKASGQLAKRLRDWSGGWIPELDTIDDHERYLELLTTEDPLKELGRDESIGTPLADDAKEALQRAAETVKALYEEKRRLATHVERRLQRLTPSTLALCGPSITAELLSSAGSLDRLARLPSGTIQLLGAETALFRHLKNKNHKPPKHGLIFNHQLIQGVKRKDRGKAARALADKIAIAIKVDKYEGTPCGEQLRKALEARFA